MDNKGISQIITTILIIALVMVSIGIVWAVIQNIVSQQSEDIESGLERISLFIVGSSVEISESEVSLVVQRDVGAGNLQEIRIILYDENGESQSTDVDASGLGELGSKKFEADRNELATITKISIAPIAVSSSGKKTPKNIVYTYKVPS
jgi:hypothetical protein